MDIKHLSEEVEQVSQSYAEKFHIERDATWFILKLQEEVGELVQSYLMMTGKARTKGKSPEEIQSEFHKEVADVLCQTLLLARFHGIDLDKEIEEKWLRWNKQ
ncbi:pyrophosphatase [Ktedonobacteria bacterium brp13]|nr:pyrophosphatase [Ktedonobacteria bacterium brp13]